MDKLKKNRYESKTNIFESKNVKTCENNRLCCLKKWNNLKQVNKGYGLLFETV